MVIEVNDNNAFILASTSGLEIEQYNLLSIAPSAMADMRTNTENDTASAFETSASDQSSTTSDDVKDDPDYVDELGVVRDAECRRQSQSDDDPRTSSTTRTESKLGDLTNQQGVSLEGRESENAIDIEKRWAKEIKLLKSRHREKISNLKVQLQKKQNELKTAKAQIKAQGQDIDQLQEKCLQSEENWQRVQAESLRLRKNMRGFEEPDDIVISELQMLFAQTRRWARARAQRSFRPMEPDQKQSVIDILSEGPIFNCFASKRVANAIKSSLIAPWVILNSIVNRIVCHNVFERPFGILEDGGISDGEQTLEWILQMARMSKFAHSSSPDFI